MNWTDLSHVDSNLGKLIVTLILSGRWGQKLM